MPAVPGTDFVVVEPEFVFGGFGAVLDRSTMAIDFDQSLDAGPGGYQVKKNAVSLSAI